jgi:hypothetical protein
MAGRNVSVIGSFLSRRGQIAIESQLPAESQKGFPCLGLQRMV